MTASSRVSPRAGIRVRPLGASTEGWRPPGKVSKVNPDGSVDALQNVVRRLRREVGDNRPGMHMVHDLQPAHGG